MSAFRAASVTIALRARNPSPPTTRTGVLEKWLRKASSSVFIRFFGGKSTGLKGRRWRTASPRPCAGPPTRLCRSRRHERASGEDRVPRSSGKRQCVQRGGPRGRRANSSWRLSMAASRFPGRFAERAKRSEPHCNCCHRGASGRWGRRGGQEDARGSSEQARQTRGGR